MSNFKSLNQNHLLCGRVLMMIGLVILTITYMSFVLVNIWKDYNPISITICYYSIWGTLLALFSKLFSIIAIFKESWFRVAYITTELSYSTNLMITVVFWGVIWPFYSGHIEHRNNQDDLK